MPELPEVETTRRGIAPYVEGERVAGVIVREHRLRWPIPNDLEAQLRGQTVETLKRRAKYLLFHTARGTLIVHLGMSGSLRVLTPSAPVEKHDHFDLVFANNRCLRYRDPRRFGAALWTRDAPLEHKLLAHLGPEPLDNVFNGAWLHRASRKRKVAVKSLLMDSHVVVGVGNIYASEALFCAGLRPTKAAGRVSKAKYDELCAAVKRVLAAAIDKGGTTLRDFVDSEGQPGYFANELLVYGRKGEPCTQCGTPIRQQVIGQRSSFFCPACQQ